jgi:hypothetical protein
VKEGVGERERGFDRKKEREGLTERKREREFDFRRATAKDVLRYPRRLSMRPLACSQYS